MRLILVLAIALLAAAEPAGAAYLSRDHFQASLFYGADPGEANRLTVESEGGTVTFTDPGAEIRPTEGCEAASAHVVSCELPYRSWYASLDDGDDTARAIARGVRDGGGASLDGGEGNDWLEFESSSGTETIYASRGDDVAIGGAGPTTLYGGGGVDRLADRGGTNVFDDQDVSPSGGSAAIDADTIAGGPGPDTLTYGLRTAPVSVDLAQGSAGEAGEGNRVSGIENVSGGQAADLLLGSGAPNLFDGGDGDDRINGRGGSDELLGQAGSDQLRGRAGADFLDGGEGDDLMFGGAGADRFFVDSDRDDARCGFQSDVVWFRVPWPLPRDCERVQSRYRSFETTAHPPRVDARGRTSLTVRCSNYRSAPSTCWLGYELRVGREIAAVGSVYVRGPHPRTMTIKLWREARLRLRREGTLPVTVEVENSDPPDLSVPDLARWQTTLRGGR